MPYKNYDDRLKRSKEYYEANKDEVLSKRRQKYSTPEGKKLKSEHDKKYREKHKERLKEDKQTWYQQNKESIARRNRLRKYNLTEEQLQQLEEINTCQICQSVIEDKKAHHIDHCHETGKVRGVLCQHCNRGLGCFTDDISKLTAAIEYLNHASNI